MTYTKTVWQDGDIITAQKMNNIENGIEGAGSIMYVDITSTYDESTSTTTYSATKTYNEIKEALDNGTYVMARTFLSAALINYMPLVNSYTYYDEEAHYEFANTDFTGNIHDGYYITGNYVLIHKDGSIDYKYAEKSFNA